MVNLWLLMTTLGPVAGRLRPPRPRAALLRDGLLEGRATSRRVQALDAGLS